MTRGIKAAALAAVAVVALSAADAQAQNLFEQMGRDLGAVGEKLGIGGSSGQRQNAQIIAISRQQLTAQLGQGKGGSGIPEPFLSASLAGIAQALNTGNQTQTAMDGLASVATVGPDHAHGRDCRLVNVGWGQSGKSGTPEVRANIAFCLVQAQGGWVTAGGNINGKLTMAAAQPPKPAPQPQAQPPKQPAKAEQPKPTPPKPAEAPKPQTTAKTEPPKAEAPKPTPAAPPAPSAEDQAAAYRERVQQQQEPQRPIDAPAAEPPRVEAPVAQPTPPAPPPVAVAQPQQPAPTPAPKAPEPPPAPAPAKAKPLVDLD